MINLIVHPTAPTDWLRNLNHVFASSDLSIVGYALLNSWHDIIAAECVGFDCLFLRRSYSVRYVLLVTAEPLRWLTDKITYTALHLRFRGENGLVRRGALSGTLVTDSDGVDVSLRGCVVHWRLAVLSGAKRVSHSVVVFFLFQFLFQSSVVFPMTF